MLPYTSPEEFDHRLRDTVILMGKKPIYVSSVDPDCVLRYGYLPYREEDRQLRVSGKDPTLNATELRLGYVNALEPNINGFHTTYLTRAPVRHAKQGLNQQNVMINPSSGMNFRSLLLHQGFVDLFAENFPTFQEALSVLSKGHAMIVAFNRRWAIETDKMEVFHLHWRGKKIATGLEPGVYKLPTHAQHLREVIEEQKLRVIA